MFVRAETTDDKAVLGWLPHFSSVVEMFLNAVYRFSAPSLRYSRARRLLAVVVSLPLVLTYHFRCSAFECAQPGNRLCYYTSPVDGTEQPYHVYIPRTYNPDVPSPIVLSLHGFGGRTQLAASDSWRQNFADSYGWILVSLDGRGSQSWDDIGEDDIYLVLQDLERTTPYHPALNIDPFRIYLEGCSMGGHGAFREGFRYPDRFAAIAPAAGWTTYKEFYDHWYDASASPNLPDYVDPSRQPLLETASSAMQTDNGRWLWTFITFDRNDTVNPPVNHEPIIETLRSIGSDRYAIRVGERGHCGSYCVRCNYRFFHGKETELFPRSVVYTTNDLRYNRSYWVRITRFRYLNQWARIEASVRDGAIWVRTRNILAFSLDLSKAPPEARRARSLRIDETSPEPLPHAPEVHIEALLDDAYRITRWQVRTFPSAEEHDRKHPGLSGPLGDAFRSHFVVIYGTRGGSFGARPDNPDWVAAQKFATEWNNWTSLHWGGEKPPASRRNDWWIPPYPFRPGAYVPAHQPLVQPLPDTMFGLDTLPREANMILFGDVTSNWIIAQAAPKLPIALSPQQVTVRERVYRGDHINYFFIAPSPFTEDDRYIVISRGFLSSNIDPNIHTAGNVGKDLEALPFYWPDYVVWDARREPAPTVQSPLKYLPEAFLDAGFFDDNWSLDTEPPITTASLSKTPTSCKVTLQAEDAPGGFGVQAIEYKLGEGKWRIYSEPLELTFKGRVELWVRAIDKCGQFVYDTSKTPNRGIPAAGNIEQPQRFIIDTRRGKIWQ